MQRRRHGQVGKINLLHEVIGAMVFYFRDIERIKGNEIDLVVTTRNPADESKGYVPSYYFNMVISGTDTEVGKCDLRIGHNRNTFYGGNIGYGVHEEYRGNHYAAKACLLMRELALEHGMDYLIITNSPENIASRRICEILDAKFEGIVDLPPDNEMYKEGVRQKCRYLWNIRGGEEMNIEIKKLEPSIISDFADFFDNRAFTDNREWSACYCVFFHWNDEYEKSLRTPGVDIHEHNRNLSAEMIKNGILKGYLAYDGDVAVGWVNANDKNAYEKLNPENRPDLWDGNDSNVKTKSITCFSIAPDYRRKGIASALLKRVLEDATADGYDFAEAYVRDIDETIRNYHGPEALYNKAGFVVYRNLGTEKIIRKALKE